MKAIINTDDKELSSIKFLNGNKKAEWSDFSQDEQIKFLNSIVGFHNLFSKFIKSEKQ